MNYKAIKKSRFEIIMYSSLVMGLITNFYITGLLLFLNFNSIIWSPIAGNIAFIIFLLLLRYRKILAIQAFYLTTIVVIIEIYIHTHFLGWQCSFYYFMFLLPAIFFTHNKRNVKSACIFNICIIIAFLTLVIRYLNKEAIFFINQKTILYISLSNFFFTALVAIVVVAYFNKTVLSKEKELTELNHKLTEQNLKVVNQHNNLQILMKEIHHRVKNNLQMINSLLRLQTYEIKDNNVIELFNISRQRILSMAKLHEKMYEAEDLQHINIHEHFESLIKGLLESYSTDKEISLDLKIEDVILEIDTLIPLGLLINEIITNSLKYAFINQKKGIIQLHLNQLNNQEYEMIIGDNGIGVDFEKTESGLGSKLIKAFTKQLDGSIEQLNTSGTVFKLNFRNIK